ncbi:MAG: hypothetical protein Faunusvirus52_2 [Faunusvirus sp.]|jgi:hypothetical protein|uniref:Uncharacterized protein n=1 Tax=Faunusvirus sp. TaxID=2487766 RepID=A0A3G4ZXY9_9VIRU|nr:MAG: hypothetical protein Faunusvirus52_2 [Faunusvirus sp.]
MSHKFTLVNPDITGDFPVTHQADNRMKAAEYFYQQMAELYDKDVPSFYFTIKEDDKYYNFQVKERKKGDEVKYDIEEIPVDKSSLDTFVHEYAKNASKKGGKKKHGGGYSSSDSDSGSDVDVNLDDSSDYIDQIYNTKTNYSGIRYWWYDPYLYQVKTVFIPTFKAPITPYMHIKLYLP